MGHSPPPKKNLSPLDSKLRVQIKNRGEEAQNGTDIRYLHAMFGGDPPLHGGVRKKSGEFLFCLFVCLSLS